MRERKPQTLRPLGQGHRQLERLGEPDRGASGVGSAAAEPLAAFHEFHRGLTPRQVPLLSPAHHPLCSPSYFFCQVKSVAAGSASPSSRQARRTTPLAVRWVDSDTEARGGGGGGLDLGSRHEIHLLISSSKLRVFDLTAGTADAAFPAGTSGGAWPAGMSSVPPSSRDANGWRRQGLRPCEPSMSSHVHLENTRAKLPFQFRNTLILI
jgi:hypothetical protein